MRRPRETTSSTSHAEPSLRADDVLVGSSDRICEVREQLTALAVLDVPICLRGETGTGKGAAGRYLHQMSERAGKPFVTLSMTMLTPGLELDRLVGHAAGAFTDAKGDLPGAVEAAHGGTLLLDEIGDAAPSTQGILLHVLEDRQVQRLGEHRARAVDVRVIVATNRNLEQAVENGIFRKDLYFRLPAIRITMPPLRDHPDDIPELAAALMARSAARARCPVRPLGRRETERLLAHGWPGNVRELDRALEYWLIFGRLPPELADGTGSPPPSARLAQVRAAVARRAGVKTAAARDLGVSRTTLYRWLDAEAEGTRV